MTEKRLSDLMSEANRAIDDARDTLNDAITESINLHFDAGITHERERIIKLLIDWGISTRKENNWRDDAIALELIALIKGENK